MHGLKSFFLFIGRLCISGVFLISAGTKIFDWQDTERSLVSLLYDWHSYVSFSVPLQKFFSLIMPWASIILVLTVLIELLGGLLILFGLKPRFGAFLLIIFLIPATIFFHQFWFLEGIRREMQIILFMKNVAILGGMFYVLVFGTKVPRFLPPMAMDMPEHSGESTTRL